MAVMIDPEKSSLLHAAPRLIRILRVLARHKFLGALRARDIQLAEALKLSDERMYRDKSDQKDF